MNHKICQMLVISFSALSGIAALDDVHEDFDCGPKGNENIPGWYDQTGRSEFYSKAGDPNSPFDSETGSIGFHWDEGTGQYIYIFLGTYSGQEVVLFSFSAGSYKGTPEEKVQPGEFIIGIYKNNSFIAADDLDVASASDTLVVDSVRKFFELTGPGDTAHISGELKLNSGDIASGDRLYFRMQFTNPDNHTFNVDNIDVVAR